MRYGISSLVLVSALYLAAGVVFAFTAPFAAPASAGESVISSKDRGRIAITGQLRRMVGSVDDRAAGKGEYTGNGPIEVDLAGSILTYPSSSAGAGFGGTLPQDWQAGAPSGPQPAALFTGFDDRTQRVWYDSPAFPGLMLSAGQNQGEGLDLAARYATSLAGTRVLAGVAYLNSFTPSGSSVTEVDVSASILHASGLSATIATGTRDLQGTSNIGRNNPAMWYAKLGYKAKIFDAGTTNFFVDYQTTEDLTANDHDSETWSFSVVQKFKDYTTELFVAFSVGDFDDSTTSADDDVTTGTTGTFGGLGVRLKF